MFEGLIDNPTDSLAEFNIVAIRALAELLELTNVEWVLGTTLNIQTSATDQLISMVEKTGGTAYLHGDGGENYQEVEKFTKADIELIPQNFELPTYPQVNSTSFVPGLSVIDTLMNLGVDGTRALLDSTIE